MTRHQGDHRDQSGRVRPLPNRLEVAETLPPAPRPPRVIGWAWSLPVALAWLGVAALGVKGVGPGLALPFATAAGLALALTLILAYLDRGRTERRLARISDCLESLALDPSRLAEGTDEPDLFVCHHAVRAAVAASRKAQPERGHYQSAQAPMTRSGLFDSPSGAFEIAPNPQASGEFASGDMVNRLDPRLFRWLDSSPSEQLFLGWDLGQLREKSFFEIVHPDDLDRTRGQLRTALLKGEAHGLILRVRTAQGRSKAIEMNVGARYGADMTVSHLRCHITDVTQKVRAERELRLRTRELIQVNDQLRLINRELEELKERYRDLYQNAPALYFSLDERGRVVDCNDTLLTTLGYRREMIVGHPYELLLPGHIRPLFAGRFEEFLRVGAVEVESQWTKANGEVIDVWVSASIIRDGDGRIVHSRSIAQDVTARHRLEAELKEKNHRLARANDELSARNREMDEFTHVVSHDLQEPLRTLIAFSGFLLDDYGDRLDPGGRDFVRHIVDASRRMRSLIQDLLALSRSGKVAGEFARVNLEALLCVVRADLAELIRSKGAEVHVAAPLPEVLGDRDRIGQLLANLIVNGLKYNTSPRPTVEVGCLADDPPVNQYLTVYVKDNGIGIEPKFHAKVFQLFRRLHTREEYDGTGAGLAICSKIAQAHGGRVWVESQAGQGATFFVTLHRPDPTDNSMGCARDAVHPTPVEPGD